MANYLLLRNNKESGPYTLDGLLTFGLKPYDLVWVEGKSAAWRYPSEVTELKSFAPVIEDQPFDRFYKKPVEEKLETVIEERREYYQKHIAEETPIPQKEFTKEEEKYLPKIKTVQPVIAKTRETIAENYIPKKSVFVTLPGKNSNIKKEETAAVKKTPVQQTVAPTNDINTSYAYAATQNETAPAQTVSITENPATAKVKYSQPLDDIKEMYVKTLQDRKYKIARKGFWMKNLKIAAVVIALVAVGVAVGFALKNSEKDKQDERLVAQAIVPVTTADPQTIPADTTAQLPVPQEMIPADQPPVQEEKISSLPVSNEEIVATKTKNNKPIYEDKTTLSISKNAGDFIKEKQPSDYYPAAETNAAGERSKKTRTDDGNPVAVTDVPDSPVKKSNSAAINSKVDVSTNDYQRVAFGGIRNLQVTVTNDSKYALDNVLVELQYLRPNELPLKTENIIFRGIAAHGSSTLKIPDTNRGIKVNYKIIHIESKQLNDEVANR